MDIKALTYALEVYKLGSISKAARALHMAQPNLSSIIRKLEEDLGITLFYRNSKGISATHDGIELFERAQGIVAQFNSLEQHYMHEGTSTSISITTMRSSIIFSRIARYIDSHISNDLPFKIHLRETSNNEVIEDILNDRADIGVLRVNRSDSDYFRKIVFSKGLKMQTLESNVFVLLMSKSHPFAGSEVITTDMLNPYLVVIHGDFEAPWYPSISDVYSTSPFEVRSKRYLYVYDRGSLLDALCQIHGAYTWTTTTAPEVLSGYNLIEKYCSNYYYECWDLIVYKRLTKLGKEIVDAISVLASDAK